MAVSPSPAPESKPGKVLIFGCDLQNILKLVGDFQRADLMHIGDRDTIGEEALKLFGPDLVVCTGDCFRSLLRASDRGPRAASGSARQRTPRMNARLRELLTLVVKGLSNREIARIMGLSERVVKSEVSTLLILFDASNRTELATLVAENGIDL